MSIICGKIYDYKNEYNEIYKSILSKFNTTKTQFIISKMRWDYINIIFNNKNLYYKYKLKTNNQFKFINKCYIFDDWTYIQRLNNEFIINNNIYYDFYDYKIYPIYKYYKIISFDLSSQILLYNQHILTDIYNYKSELLISLNYYYNKIYLKKYNNKFIYNLNLFIYNYKIFIFG